LERGRVTVRASGRVLFNLIDPAMRPPDAGRDSGAGDGAKDVGHRSWQRRQTYREYARRAGAPAERPAYTKAARRRRGLTPTAPCFQSSLNSITSHRDVSS